MLGSVASTAGTQSAAAASSSSDSQARVRGTTYRVTLATLRAADAANRATRSRAAAARTSLRNAQKARREPVRRGRTLGACSRRAWLAALIAVAAFGATTPAYADKAERCERKLERIEDRFRVIEARRGYEAAIDWWNDYAWPKYYERCEA